MTPSSPKPHPLAAFAARLPLVAAVSLLLAACSSAKVVSDETVKSPASSPAHVYVADFELGVDAVQSESLLAKLPLYERQQLSKARSLAATMTTDIVEDLRKKGIAADRLAAGRPLPARGWLVRGVFTKVDEGNRLARSVIGFGAGGTNVQVSASVEELSPGKTPTSLYHLQTDARSGKMPGAAVTLNPYAAAAKFVLNGRDLDRSTRETAGKIADQVAAKVKTAAH